MGVNKFTKQAYEEFTISGDYVNNLDTGEIISTQTATATDKEGTDATATVLDTVGNDGASKVTVFVKAGTEALSPYKITLRCVTSLSNKWEMDITMKIQEK